MAITSETRIEDIIQWLQGPPANRLPAGWWTWERVQEAHRRLSRLEIERCRPYPDCFEGRGVVIGAGGHVHFANAYVCARMLRHLGCLLPIQFWHYSGEIDEHMKRIVAPFGVDCVDANEIEKQITDRRRPLKRGWELKPFAVLYCPYREVLLLDSDNVPVVDPTFLFNTPEFEETGAIFWPDYSRLEQWRHIWAVCEVPYRDEPEVESGQVVVDKERCWKALSLAMHYNDHSEYYYNFIHGDKETFHLAFRRIDQPYSMPNHAIHSLDATMCQHDFHGRRVFQHRNMDKWKLDFSNRPVTDFWFEDLCRNFLADLRLVWSGRAFWNVSPNEEEVAVTNRIADKTYRYTRVGYDARNLQLLTGGLIGEGRADGERFWCVNTINEEVVLTISSIGAPTCHLKLDNGIWKGHWLHYERMPIELEKL